MKQMNNFMLMAVVASEIMALIAALCFLIAAIGMYTGKLNMVGLMSLGLFFLTLAMLFR